MISRTHKFIIITPPKTGSVSIITALMKYGDISKIHKQRVNTKDNTVECFDYSDKFAMMSKHTPISKIYNQWTSEEGNFNTYYKVGLIRNPWDRLVSWWKWKPHLSFSEFVKNIGPHHALKKDNAQLLHYFSLNDKIIVNDYIRFETLQKDFNKVCLKIGLPPQNLPHLNKSNHKPYWEYYDNNLREFVEEKYKEDIKTFNYQFGK